MKRLLLLLALAASLSAIHGRLDPNPLIPAFLTEVNTDTSHDCIIEVFNNGGYEYLDGFYLVTSRDSIGVRPGIHMDYEEYRALTQDDFLDSLVLAPEGDHLLLFDGGDYLIGEVSYGDGPVDTRAPMPGQSICAHFAQDSGYIYVDFFYLDSSPTFGYENDYMDAMGTITGTVTDLSTGLPIGGAHVSFLETFSSTSTNSGGEYSRQNYPRKVTLEVSAAGYDTFRSFALELDLGIDEVLVYDVVLEPSEGIGTEGSGNRGLPKADMLSQNYPNPFNPSTVIGFTVPGFEQAAMRVLLTIHDLRGRLIRTLVDDDRIPGGYQVSWDGTADTGAPAGSGVYLYTLRVNDLTSTRKMVIAQ